MIPASAKTSDVLVIGGGVSGALVAHGLALKGIRVTLIEAGPRVDRAASVARFQAADVKVPESAYKLSAFSPHPVTDRIEDFYVQRGPDNFTSTYLKQLGGTTWHWLGTAVRMVPDDFVLQSKFQRGVDWPIGYSELEPWYVLAERELGVSGSSHEPGEVSPRSAPYLLAAIPPSYLDSSLQKALAGSSYQLTPTPQARLSEARDGRPSCCGSGSCIPVCPIQAKYDATVHLALAEKLGVQIITECHAVLLEVAADQKVSAVQVRFPDGSSDRIEARFVVLAANAMETPRLLLSSTSAASPKGVANASDQVGRNLMDHPVQLSWGLTPRPVWPYRGPLSTSGIENHRNAAWRASKPAIRFEIGNDGWNWPTGGLPDAARRFALKGLRGTALDKALRDEASRHFRVAALIEQLPLAENRVTVDTDLKDGAGLRRPVIHYRHDDYVKDGLALARQMHGEIARLAGLSHMQHAPGPFGAGHILGTARMGKDAKTSVVDASLRSHDHPNLYIVGASAFPTGATANPTLTIAALALRAVPDIAQAVAGN